MDRIPMSKQYMRLERNWHKQGLGMNCEQVTVMHKTLNWVAVSNGEWNQFSLIKSICYYWEDCLNLQNLTSLALTLKSSNFAAKVNTLSTTSGRNDSSYSFTSGSFRPTQLWHRIVPNWVAVFQPPAMAAKSCFKAAEEKDKNGSQGQSSD